jgi:hypothetical protein
MMMAIAGRFPPLPGVRGFAPLVTVGAMIVVVGLVLSGLVTLVAVVRKRRHGGRPAGRAE